MRAYTWAKEYTCKHTYNVHMSMYTQIQAHGTIKTYTYLHKFIWAHTYTPSYTLRYTHKHTHSICSNSHSYAVSHIHWWTHSHRDRNTHTNKSQCTPKLTHTHKWALMDPITYIKTYIHLQAHMYTLTNACTFMYPQSQICSNTCNQINL